MKANRLCPECRKAYHASRRARPRPMPMLKSNVNYFRERAAVRCRAFYASFREHGLKGVAQRVSHHISWLRVYRQRDAAFDKTLGVDTSGPVGLWRLRLASGNAQHSQRYEAIDPGILDQAFHDIPEPLAGFTFIDLGCGKGRALLLASKYGFSEIIGIEFAAQLAEVARRNCHRLNMAATVICDDALKFRFPRGKLVVYFNNPFGPPVLNPVLDTLLETDTTTCYCVYVNPKHAAECLDHRPQLQCLTRNSNYVIWKVIPNRLG